LYMCAREHQTEKRPLAVVSLQKQPGCCLMTRLRGEGFD
jgi:hypothetical protein